MNTSKRKLAIISIFCVLLSGILQGCSSAQPIQLDIEVSGHKIQLDDTFQDVYDNGLVLCETDGTIIDLASCDEMAGKTYEIKTLNIGVPIDDKTATPSCMIVYPYNDSISSQPLSSCKIYLINVSYLFGDSEEVSITVNGKDVLQTEPEEFLAHFGELGITYDDENKIEKFLDSSTGAYLVHRIGDYTYNLKSEKRRAEKPDPHDFGDEDGNYDDEAYMAACEEAEQNAPFGITEFKYEKLIEKSYN